MQTGGEPLASDRVYWGVVDDSGGIPEMLMSERKFAEAWFGALPVDQRAKYRVARTYVTVWAISRAARKPAR